jgi:hypothetical protein
LVAVPSTAILVWHATRPHDEESSRIAAAMQEQAEAIESQQQEALY